ncbi:hypothetical protein BGZ73_000082 [Actinomortierella ambigua]|nr:hypothetical protein BGZ73_000082 [Actinomortierella ambigua]
MTNFEDRNQAHFDATASKYETNPFADILSTKCVNTIVGAYKAVNPEHQQARVFEFGIGTGLVAFKIAPFVKSIVGVDISESMLEQVSKKQQDPLYADVASKITTIRHHVKDEDPYPAATAEAAAVGQGFDLVYSSAVMHHIENAPGMIKTLVKNFVKAGSGWFYIVDFQHEEDMANRWEKVVNEVFHAGNGHAHGHAHTHHHHHHLDQKGEHAHNGHQAKGEVQKISDIVPHTEGFKDDDLRRWLSDAGLVDIHVQRGFSQEFFIPSEGKELPIHFVLAAGRRL